MLVHDWLEEGAHGCPKQNGVRHFHHGGLHVEREQCTLVVHPVNFRGQEGFKLVHGQRCTVDDFAGLQGKAFFQDRLVAVAVDVDDVHRGGVGHRHALLGAVEIAFGHARHTGEAVRGPSTHAVRVFLSVRLHRFGRAAVAVAFAQHGVHCGAFHLVVARFDAALFVRGGFVGVIGQVESQCLELSYCRLQLRDGGADVGELDDVGVWRFGQSAQLAQGVVGGLIAGQYLRHRRQNAAAERNVTGLHRHAGLASKCLNDGKKAVSRQGGCLVRKGVENLRHAAANVGNPDRSRHLRAAPFASRRRASVLLEAPPPSIPRRRIRARGATAEGAHSPE